MTTTTPEYTVDLRAANEDGSELEFVVAQSNYTGDLGKPWYTVVVRNANQGSRRRFAVWYRSPYKPGTVRRVSALPVQSVAHQSITQVVKNHLAAQ